MTRLCLTSALTSYQTDSLITLDAWAFLGFLKNVGFTSPPDTLVGLFAQNMSPEAYTPLLSLGLYPGLGIKATPALLMPVHCTPAHCSWFLCFLSFRRCMAGGRRAYRSVGMLTALSVEHNSCESQVLSGWPMTLPPNASRAWSNNL